MSNITDNLDKLNRLRLIAGVPIKAEHGRAPASTQLDEQQEDYQQQTHNYDEVISIIKKVIDIIDKEQEQQNDSHLDELYQSDKINWCTILRMVRKGNVQDAARRWRRLDTASRDYIEKLPTKRQRKIITKFFGAERLHEKQEDYQDNHDHDEDVNQETSDKFNTYNVTFKDEQSGEQSVHVKAKTPAKAKDRAKQRMPDGAQIVGSPEKVDLQDVTSDEKVSEAHNYTDAYPSHDEDERESINVVGYDDDDASTSTASPEYTKTEVPQQTDNKGEQSSTDQDTETKVPNHITQELQDVITQFRDEAERLEKRGGSTAMENRRFYLNTADAFEDLLGYLELGTIEGIKHAQIYASKLMGPMLHKIPTNVWKFIQRGGINRSLKSYMGKVSDDYPITGPQNSLDDNSNW